MNDLEIDFTSETEQGSKVSVKAIFEHVSDFVETSYGERKESYWHLISLQTKHHACPHMFFGCGCYEPTKYEYGEFESEAKKLASKEAA